MKYYTFLFVFLVVCLKTANALNVHPSNNFIPRSPIDDSRFEMIDEHAFFVLNIEKEDIDIKYGDKVELKFGFNSVVTVYNISNSNTKFSSNRNELVAFIPPESLRCFANKSLKKVIIHTGGKAVVVKTNIAPNQLKLKP